jgi:hypothetical protein
MWALSMELASCQPSGANNFELAPRFVISDFPRAVDKIRALLRYHAALSGSSVPTFRDNLSVQSSRVKKSKKNKDFIQRCVTSHKGADLILLLDVRKNREPLLQGFTGFSITRCSVRSTFISMPATS